MTGDRDHEAEPVFNLHVTRGSKVSLGALAIPVPKEQVQDNGEISFDDLAAWAIRGVSVDYEEYHQRIAAALDRLEELPGVTLEVRGPADGYMHIELPEDDPGAGEDAS